MDLYDINFLGKASIFLFFVIVGVLIFLEFNYASNQIGKAGVRKRRILNWKLGMLTIVIALPVSALTAAYYCEYYKIGLFYTLNPPFWLVFILWLAMADFLTYWYHRMSHSVKFLWKLHKVHHSDTSLNVTNFLRFHPLEYSLSKLLKISMIFVLGPYFMVVLIVDFIQAVIVAFAHSNIKLNNKVEKFLAYFIVTPRYHLIHHTITQSNKNLSIIFTYLDKLFNRRVEPVLEAEKLKNLTLGLGPRIRHNTIQDMLLLKPFLLYLKSSDKHLYLKYSAVALISIISFGVIVMSLPSLWNGVI